MLACAKFSRQTVHTEKIDDRGDALITSLDGGVVDRSENGMHLQIRYVCHRHALLLGSGVI